MFQIKNPVRVGVISLGCPKNTVDTECMLAVLGVPELVDDPYSADVIIINTCAFLNEARKESEKAIEAMLDTGKKVVVAGCYVSKDIKYLKSRYPDVFGWAGVNDIKNIKKAVFNGGSYNSSRPWVYTAGLHTALINPYSAYAKISEGCGHKCSFCLIPAIKGGYRSRKKADIVEEIKNLTGAGVREINLISQDLSYYGRDIYKKHRLPGLVSDILKKVKGDYWLRLMYIYPDIKVIKELVKIMESDSRLCRYLDIPFQHVDDSILAGMKRGYDGKYIDSIINYLRGSAADITIRSTFITGFPGETKKQFHKLEKFILQGNVDKAGIFGYSDEPGTEAFKYAKKIKPGEITRRAERLMLASRQVCYYNDTQKEGSEKRVLVTGPPVKGNYAARAQDAAPDIDGYIYFKSKQKIKPGSFVKLRMKKPGKNGPQGELV